jgi:hypothetical protein
MQIFVKEDIQTSWMMVLDKETLDIILHCYLKYWVISSVNHTSCFLIVNNPRYWKVSEITRMPFWFRSGWNRSRDTSIVIPGLHTFIWSLINTGNNSDISLGATNAARVSSISDVVIQLARQLSTYTLIQIKILPERILQLFSRPRNSSCFNFNSRLKYFRCVSHASIQWVISG